MYKSQWESLFMKNTSACAKGVNDCPCQYNARPGITTKIMDVTMCCLVINNICSGINVSDVNTIREIRNKLIHAASGHLDQLTFTDYWSKVTTALLNLAFHVSSSVHKDTLSMINELQKRVMNPEELGELRKVVMDEKRIKDLEVVFYNIMLFACPHFDQASQIQVFLTFEYFPSKV
ncbi:hypothetical protein FSP39_003773 [Pinctada imbricata]|uniref:DZIP3-like HEPN domain-containing protein n=1 Tax=Pinctada imbricata TaxID=66713 RepID=A0AA89CBV0_PINIB|nr:hypothetical protein FSP39_003773 [Pinctada imbricata]